MKKKITALLLIVAMLSFSCSETAHSSESEETAAQTPESVITVETEEETEPALYKDSVPELSFDGEAFDIVTREIGHMNYLMNADEITADPLNDAIYNRNRSLESRFDIVITETLGGENTALTLVTAGDDTYELVKNRGPMSVTFFQKNLMYLVTDIPYIDLSQPWWDRNLNEALTICGRQFIVSGALSVTEYDYTSALLFNKQLTADLGLTSPYDLVKSGGWTFDAMNEMMMTSLNDLDGNGVYDSEDRYGYLASPKHVLASFLISGGELSITKDEKDIPRLSVEEERYIDVFNKVFDITIDNGTWYSNSSGDNVSAESIRMFSENKSLFMDIVMFYLEQLRDMESDFGVIPYPKYDDNQDDYVSRTSWIEPFIVPVTNTKLDMTGAVIEAMCCESANTVIPAYYEISLKGKISRDEDSSEMLDLIFSHRVIDFGDTIWVEVVRDGALSGLYSSNNRNIVSRTKMMSKQVEAKLKKLQEIIPDLDQGE